MDCNCYYDSLIKIYEEDPGSVFLDHPTSDRYQVRAPGQLGPLIEEGECIGFEIARDDAKEKSVYVILFREPMGDDLLNDVPGVYGAFDIVTGKVDNFKYIRFFGFYDGLDPYGDDFNNPILLSKEEATEYMIQNFGHKHCE